MTLVTINLKQVDLRETIMEVWILVVVMIIVIAIIKFIGKLTGCLFWAIVILGGITCLFSAGIL